MTSIKRFAFLAAALAPSLFVLNVDQAVASGVAEQLAPAAKELGEPIPGLTDAEEDLHIRGRRLFRWELWRPDAGVNGFNSRECSECHIDPEIGGSSREDRLRVAFIPHDGDPSGFKTYHRLQRDANRRFQTVNPPADAEFRRAPALWGLGLLEAVPQANLDAIADPTDANGDGISGRQLTIGNAKGRFGWRGSVATVESFVISAFKNELGMNISPFDREDFTGLGMSQIKAVTFHNRTVSPPPRPVLDATSKAGKELFNKIGCNSCHTPQMKTGKTSIKALNDKVIEAYTNLMLHDMSPSKSLHEAPEKPAAGEFRTPPLWGIGAFKGPLWHDGSAPNIEAAILKHDGEGLASKKKFEALSAAEKQRLLAFLNKL